MHKACLDIVVLSVPCCVPVDRHTVPLFETCVSRLGSVDDQLLRGGAARDPRVARAGCRSAKLCKAVPQIVGNRMLGGRVEGSGAGGTWHDVCLPLCLALIGIGGDLGIENECSTPTGGSNEE